MAARQRKRHTQLTLDKARKPTGRGGWRPKAGRKNKPGAVSHRARLAFAARFPQHVTIRVVEGAPSLAREWLMKIIRKAIRDSHGDGFQIVEFNVLGNHVHLIIEAASKERLATGTQGLEVRLARRLNRALRRRGKLFAHRYHSRTLKTPTEVRHALRYVLLNRKHHAAERKFSKWWIDPFSSAPWFTGWAQRIVIARDLADEPAPNARPTAWLLTTGWKRWGPLRFEDRPGAVIDR